MKNERSGYGRWEAGKQVEVRQPRAVKNRRHRNRRFPSRARAKQVWSVTLSEGKL